MCDGPSIGYDDCMQTVCDRGHIVRQKIMCAICSRNAHGCNVQSVCVWQTLYGNRLFAMVGSITHDAWYEYSYVMILGKSGFYMR